MLPLFKENKKTTVAKMIKYRLKTFEDCINEVARIFLQHFRNDIHKLLCTYPLDMKTKEGKLFWTLPKDHQEKSVNLIQNESHKHSLHLIQFCSLRYSRLITRKISEKPEGKSKIAGGRDQNQKLKILFQVHKNCKEDSINEMKRRKRKNKNKNE